MARTKQDRKEKWERERVQRVLDYHNMKYRTHIVIKDKCSNIYPNLKGGTRWDWVCYDTKTGDEIAVEVKKLTDPKLEQKSKVMWQLLEEVRNSFSKSQRLPGTFSLSVDIPKDYYLPFNERGKRQEFKNALCKVIYETAQRLKLGETEDLKPEITEQLPFVLPDVSVCDLHKFSDEGNVLYRGSGITGWGSIGFDNSELEQFEQLVSYANKQLMEANVQQTFLVFIEEGYRPIDPPEVEEAFKNINSISYSEIRYVYFIRGKEVTEIPLPVIPSSAP